jgi:hypothetical protein
MRSRFTLTLIDPARANFDSPPEPDKDTREVSLRNAIWPLTPTFRKLKRRRYSRQKLVELLAEQNTHVTLPSLRDYLGDKASSGRAAPAAGEPTPAPAGGPEASSLAVPRPARGQRQRP